MCPAAAPASCARCLLASKSSARGFRKGDDKNAGCTRLLRRSRHPSAGKSTRKTEPAGNRHHHGRIRHPGKNRRPAKLARRARPIRKRRAQSTRRRCLGARCLPHHRRFPAPHSPDHFVTAPSGRGLKRKRLSARKNRAGLPCRWRAGWPCNRPSWSWRFPANPVFRSPARKS